MKLLSTRTAVLMLLIVLFVLGLAAFNIRYFNSAFAWAHSHANRHYYKNGMLSVRGTVYDRNGDVLLMLSGESIEFNAEKDVRTAVMHVTGDREGSVSTGVLSTLKGRLTGWNLFSGAYRLHKKSRSELTLTIDSGLCRAAYREMKGRKGAVGIYNYETGEIICLISSPSFDPQNPPDVEGNPEKYEGVYLNRFLSSAYTPGSIFKLVTAAAALENIPDIENKHYLCEGRIAIGPDSITCLKAHGRVSLQEALAVSCNAFFAGTALELGAETLQKYAEACGFNNSLEVDGIRTAAGKINLNNAVGADLGWAGAGQYTTTANPLNFMAFMGAIAGGGEMVQPRLIADNSSSFFDFRPGKKVLKRETADKLKAMMRNNTITSYGEEKFKDLELCAKSGTAEVGGGKEPHAWFAGFLDRKDCPLAFAVIIENGITSRAAADVAARVLQEAAKALKQGRNL